MSHTEFLVSRSTGNMTEASWQPRSAISKKLSFLNPHSHPFIAAKRDNSQDMVTWYALHPTNHHHAKLCNMLASSQNAFMLKFLASNEGKWDRQKYAAGLQLSFGRGSEYDIHGQLEGSVDSKLWPIQGPWIQAGVRNFLQNLSRGVALENAADCFDDQADAYAKLIPLAAARGYAAVVAGAAEDPGNLQRFKTTAMREVLDAVAVYQGADIALGGGLIAARVVFDIVATGASPIDAIERAIQDLEKEGGKPNPHPKKGQEMDAVRTPFGEKWAPALQEAVIQWAKENKKPYSDIVGHFGQSCSLYHSLQTPLAAIYLHAAQGKAGQDLYVDALRDIHRGGGCSGSRCNLAGAIAGGQGLDAVPQSWQERTLRLGDYKRQATALLQAIEKQYANRRIETWSVEMMDGKSPQQ